MWRLVPPVAFLCALAFSPSAHAVALHGLTPAGCIADTGDVAGCGSVQQGLLNAQDVAISPDGRSVYVVSSMDDAIARFTRGPTGTLTPAGCISDVGDTAGCGSTAQGLDGAIDVAVSPDGRSVYVTSFDDQALVRFDRTTDGALQPAGCIADAGAPAGCGSSQEGMGGAGGVTVSPDGTSVYVASFNDSAVVRFNRTSSGALTAAGCIMDVGAATSCSGTQQGLNGAFGIAASPDGGSVYVAGNIDDAVAQFNRTPDGSLTPAGCVADVGDSAGCGVTQQGLNGARRLAVSPDSASAYVTADADSAVSRFNRAANGALTGAGCISDAGDPAGCGTTAQGLAFALGIAVSPDGASVYVTGLADASLVRFTRAPSGALTGAGCFADPPDFAGCGATQQGLDGGVSTVVSPNDASVYVAAGPDRAISTFEREIPPVCLGTAAATPPGQPVAVPLDCSDPNGDALTLELLDTPANGTLGAIDQIADTVMYTPNGGFTGNDAFSYRAIADGKASNLATAHLDVEPPQGTTGPTGPAGTDGTTGAQGPTGPAGPAGEPAITLLLGLAADRLSARAGRRVKVKYVITAPAALRLEIYRRTGRRPVARVSGRSRRPGRGAIRWNGRIKRKRAKAGRYRIVLRATGGDRQTARDQIPLRLR